MNSVWMGRRFYLICEFIAKINEVPQVVFCVGTYFHNDNSKNLEKMTSKKSSQKIVDRFLIKLENFPAGGLAKNFSTKGIYPLLQGHMHHIK